VRDRCAGANKVGPKRRKSDAERAKEAGEREQAKRARAEKLEAAAASTDPDAVWRVKNAQPWAEHEVKAAELNDEQKAYLAEVLLSPQNSPQFVLYFKL
jgi:hypothetical protein